MNNQLTKQTEDMITDLESYGFDDAAEQLQDLLVANSHWARIDAWQRAYTSLFQQERERDPKTPAFTDLAYAMKKIKKALQDAAKAAHNARK